MKMNFSIKDFFSKYDQIRRLLRTWSHLLKRSLIKNFIFCAVNNKNIRTTFRDVVLGDSLLTLDRYQFKLNKPF